MYTTIKHSTIKHSRVTKAKNALKKPPSYSTRQETEEFVESAKSPKNAEVISLLNNNKFWTKSHSLRLFPTPDAVDAKHLLDAIERTALYGSPTTGSDTLSKYQKGFIKLTNVLGVEVGIKGTVAAKNLELDSEMLLVSKPQEYCAEADLEWSNDVDYIQSAIAEHHGAFVEGFWSLIEHLAAAPFGDVFFPLGVLRVLFTDMGEFTRHEMFRNGVCDKSGVCHKVFALCKNANDESGYMLKFPKA
jgi:hypothetical protein